MIIRTDFRREINQAEGIMGSDLTLPADDGVFNFRVGAIIMRGDEFLMTGNGAQGYLYSVGGRVRFGETAEQAVVREVFEETGTLMQVDRLGFVHENFFIDGASVSSGKPVHELSLFFYMRVPEDFRPVCKSLTHGRKEFLEWVDRSTPKRIFPEFFRTELASPSDAVKLIVTRDA